MSDNLTNAIFPEKCDCGEPFKYVRWHVPTQGVMCATCFNRLMAKRIVVQQ